MRSGRQVKLFQVQCPDEDSQWVNPQPEHIELAGALGLGMFDREKIQLKKIDLG